VRGKVKTLGEEWPLTPQGEARTVRYRLSLRRKKGAIVTHRDLALPEGKGSPFSARGWIFEFKYQGYRCLGIRDGKARLVSRQGREMSDAFPALIREIAQLPDRTAIDGELVLLDEVGRPQFDRLLGRASVTRPSLVGGHTRKGRATIFAWDILVYAGRDMRSLPLTTRKIALEQVLLGFTNIHLAGHVVEEGERLYAEAVAWELEGIMAKRAESIYTAGRTPDWIKSTWNIFTSK
jgi:bifunctional non-homologous end joining protein LigD